jgi:hypothetical protein
MLLFGNNNQLMDAVYRCVALPIGTRVAAHQIRMQVRFH